MKKLILSTAIVAALGVGVSTSASAALVSNSTLNLSPSVLGGYYGNVIVSGSYFAMDNDGDGIFAKSERVGLAPGTDGGIKLGAAQGYGTSTGSGATLVITAPGGVDAGWSFFSAAGWQTHAAGTINVATDDGAGNVTLDMTGWNVHWNGGDIDMGTGAAAVVTCGVDCGNGDTYSLDYTAIVPSGGFTGVAYQLHTEGTVSAVPVPAAVWLFGSGLLGLVGIARRKKLA